jgi:hypothetical protein
MKDPRQVAAGRSSSRKSGNEEDSEEPKNIETILLQSSLVAVVAEKCKEMLVKNPLEGAKLMSSIANNAAILQGIIRQFVEDGFQDFPPATIWFENAIDMIRASYTEDEKSQIEKEMKGVVRDSGELGVLGNDMYGRVVPLLHTYASAIIILFLTIIKGFQEEMPEISKSIAETYEECIKRANDES